MKKDAFDDVICPFDYRAELNKAREVLNAKVGAHVSENKTKGYRELAEKFRISVTAMCKIAKKYSRKRKLGRPLGRRVVFNVRDRIDSKGPERQVIVSTRRKGVSVEMMRQLVVRYFSDSDVSVSRTTKAGGHAEYDYDEFQALNTPIHYSRKAAEYTRGKAAGIEMDLRALADASSAHRRSESGEIAYQSVIRWLNEHSRKKDGLYDRAQRIAAEYAKFRGS